MPRVGDRVPVYEGCRRGCCKELYGDLLVVKVEGAMVVFEFPRITFEQRELRRVVASRDGQGDFTTIEA
jgi:hypothetical protein